MARKHDDGARARSRIGRVLRGKYTLDRVLGVGGVATVYAATHRNGRRVAIKVLHDDLSLRSDVRLRFIREGQAANAVRHPGVAAVIDDDVADDGEAFIVLELLEGKVLEELWEQAGKRLPPWLVLAMARELCGILDAAHRAKIVHRDLKPENLFLTHDAKLKVLDFGLAQVRDAAAPNLTITGMIFGTPAFMAPEQAAGRTSQIDPRTDLWAVGATMFTLLSGRTVHEGETAQDIVIQCASKPARSLTTVLPGADPGLASVVDRALAMERRDRWPSAAELRDAICRASLAICGEAEPELIGPDDFTRVEMEDLTRVATTPPPGPDGEETMFGAHETTATTTTRRAAAESSAPVSDSALDASVDEDDTARNGTGTTGRPGWTALRDAIDNARAGVFGAQSRSKVTSESDIPRGDRRHGEHRALERDEPWDRAPLGHVIAPQPFSISGMTPTLARPAQGRLVAGVRRLLYRGRARLQRVGEGHGSLALTLVAAGAVFGATILVIIIATRPSSSSQTHVATPPNPAPELALSARPLETAREAPATSASSTYRGRPPGAPLNR